MFRSLEGSQRQQQQHSIKISQQFLDCFNPFVLAAELPPDVQSFCPGTDKHKSHKQTVRVLAASA